MFGLMEAMMGFVRRQIGLRDDAASATGSAHAKLTYLQDYAESGFLPGTCTASDTLQYSDDTEDTESVGQTPELVRSILFYRNGTVRVKFDAYTGYTDVYAQIYIDGVARGTERNVTGSYVTYSEDFNIGFGQEIQIWARRADSNPQNILTRNFRVYFTPGTAVSVGATKGR